MTSATIRGVAIVRFSLDVDEESHPTLTPEEVYDSFLSDVINKELLTDHIGEISGECSVEVETFSSLDVRDDDDEEAEEQDISDVVTGEEDEEETELS